MATKVDGVNVAIVAVVVIVVIGLAMLQYKWCREDGLSVGRCIFELLDD